MTDQPTPPGPPNRPAQPTQPAPAATPPQPGAPAPSQPPAPAAPATQPSAIQTAEPAQNVAAQIYDQGYRAYDGPRTGYMGAMRALIWFSIKTALGMGRSARYKIVPVLMIVAAFVPAIVFVGIAALLGDVGEEFLPTYPEYYGFIVAAIYLFAGFVAPELLSPDRRTGMLGVYLASPLNRPAYLIGKAIAVVSIILIVTLGPTLLLLIAYSLEDLGPSGFIDWMTTFGKILLSGVTLGVLYAAVALAVSASTDRSMIATATILAMFPASAIVSDILVNEADQTSHLRLLNIPNMPRDLVFRIHDQRGLWSPIDNPTWTLWAAWVFWVGLSLAFVWFKYRRLLVRR